MATPPRQSRFAVVGAVRGDASHLDDFIKSIEEQEDFDLAQLQVVMVVAGEPPAPLVRWQARRPELVSVVRNDDDDALPLNVGLAAAAAEWVTFADPDDFVHRRYFAAADGLIRANPEVNMVAANRMTYNDLTQTVGANPLRRMFGRHNEVVDLNGFPDYFYGFAHAAFFRLDAVRKLGLAFDGDVFPDFDEALFCCEYLLGVEPVVVFATDARYFRRRRTTRRRSGAAYRYVTVPRLGYLRVLETAAARGGQAPEWLQNYILYEVSAYFAQEQRATAGDTAATGDTAVEFLRILAEIWKHLTPEVVAAYHATVLPPQTRDIWLHGFAGEDWHTPYAVVDRLDDSQRLVRVRFRYLGPEPAATYLVGGEAVTPAYQKTHTFELFDHVLMREKIAWVPIGTLRVQLDGRFVPLRPDNPEPDLTIARPRALRGFVAPEEEPSLAQPPVKFATLRPEAKPYSIRNGFLPWLHAKLGKLRFDDAWVLMDRTFVAADNAERLFEYLRSERPDINAFYCVERKTSTYKRLKAGPNRRRVIAFGGPVWRSLMMRCTHMISSQCSPSQMTPARVRGLRPFDWRFIFLQHGVIATDLSRWLNTKDIDLFVTSTKGEYDSIAGDGPYVFTGKEVKLTGQPRYDRLHRLGREIAPADRDLILVAPTWREWLTLPATRGNHRELVPDFAQSEYVTQWVGLLSSPKLRELAERHNKRVVFFPHLSLGGALRQMKLPDWIEIRSIENEDIQRLLARGAVLLTDYSSIVFDIVFLGRQCVYFQFDEDRVLHGEHPARLGYFDYRRDGFGPVVTTADDALAALERALDCAPDVDPAYRERIEKTFTLRDESACERIVAEIEKTADERA